VLRCARNGTSLSSHNQTADLGLWERWRSAARHCMHCLRPARSLAAPGLRLHAFPARTRAPVRVRSRQCAWCGAQPRRPRRRAGRERAQVGVRDRELAHVRHAGARLPRRRRARAAARPRHVQPRRRRGPEPPRLPGLPVRQLPLGRRRARPRRDARVGDAGPPRLLPCIVLHRVASCCLPFRRAHARGMRRERDGGRAS
jgi:hypothetical protein